MTTPRVKEPIPFTTETWWVFAAIADLYGQHDRWPTVEEFATYAKIDQRPEVMVELRTILEELRLATADLELALGARDAV
jgi:hypothetical protein